MQDENMKKVSISFEKLGSVEKPRNWALRWQKTEDN